MGGMGPMGRMQAQGFNPMQQQGSNQMPGWRAQQQFGVPSQNQAAGGSQQQQFGGPTQNPFSGGSQQPFGSQGPRGSRLSGRSGRSGLSGGPLGTGTGTGWGSNPATQKPWDSSERKKLNHVNPPPLCFNSRADFVKWAKTEYEADILLETTYHAIVQQGYNFGGWQKAPSRQTRPTHSLYLIGPGQNHALYGTGKHLWGARPDINAKYCPQIGTGVQGEAEERESEANNWANFRYCQIHGFNPIYMGGLDTKLLKLWGRGLPVGLAPPGSSPGYQQAALQMALKYLTPEGKEKARRNAANAALNQAGGPGSGSGGRQSGQGGRPLGNTPGLKDMKRSYVVFFLREHHISTKSHHILAPRILIKPRKSAGIPGEVMKFFKKRSKKAPKYAKPPPRPFATHSEFVNWARIESETGDPAAVSRYQQILAQNLEFGGWIKVPPGGKEYSLILQEPGKGMYGTGEWRFGHDAESLWQFDEMMGKDRERERRMKRGRRNPREAAFMGRYGGGGGMHPGMFRPGWPGPQMGAGGGWPSFRGMGGMNNGFGGPQQFGFDQEDEQKPQGFRGFGQESPDDSSSGGEPNRFAPDPNKPEVTHLGGPHTEVNGMQTDDPRFFHPDFGNAGPPNSRPVSPNRNSSNSSTPSLRGGGRDSDNRDRKRAGGGGGGNNNWSKKGNPLKGWGKDNWAKPRNEGRDPRNVPAATVYEDDEPAKPPPEEKKEHKRSPKPQRRRSSPRPRTPPPPQQPLNPSNPSKAPTLTLELRAAHPHGDIRFPPPNQPYPNPLKILTTNGRRIIYRLLYQNPAPSLDDMREGIAEECEQARKSMSDEINAKIRVIQAKDTGTLELVSEGPRGKIWKVDHDALEVAGCLLEMETATLAGGIRERFELFGYGMKEFHDDVLLISWPVE
ncbi:hypothetical protein CC80DRAFT_551525 [Byssothecium circinans]|uniref:Uncharacterized protein n=1 Tax=Byssothecium circinans TaxID=147558 RepID=A0A6A5TKA0_9PLEO|nr:hypothetical protein CC80DRAFT_551525 [Byssothecium circinans]